MTHLFYLLIFFCHAGQIYAQLFPIQFSIPECKVVQDIPQKTQDFASIIPGDASTYIYRFESDYYQDYQRSYFAVTCKKAGWDCLRHYEILANGCIPYFIDLDLCCADAMPFLPKELIKEAMNLEGVSYRHIDHEKFDQEKYNEILKKMLAHTRNHLTTRQMADYLLKTVNYSGQEKILYLSANLLPDYIRCLTLIGLKEIMGERVIDVPKIEHIYVNYPWDIAPLYGRGISYTKIIEDLPVDRSNIEQRIANKEFDLIIYGSVHRGLPFHDLVLDTYEPEKVVYLCGEDAHMCPYSHWNNFFLREW